MNSYHIEPHSFQIPVMGTGFSVDTPLKVAKYGISSVISLVDDALIEQMRKFHSEKNDIEYTPILKGDEDWRARRITSYLNLLDDLIDLEIKEMLGEEFIEGSQITKYYELLPENDLKRKYLKMKDLTVGEEKTNLQNYLRSQVTKGSIDVNIMTKLDNIPFYKGKLLDVKYSDAAAALRGYAKSKLNSSMIFSAGLNPRLYDAISQYKDFLPDVFGKLKKKIVIKVSDFRSATIQGRALARKGLWVSEFRIESGLNCGGHAFASKGILLGPVLEEFHKGKVKLMETLAGAFLKSGGDARVVETGVKITVQGGIGTTDEDEFLRDNYELDGTGWGTPFMLVPEVININKDHLRKLSLATKTDVYLSNASPLGVLFWNIGNSASEIARKLRISKGVPGSPCVNKHAALSTEFSDIPQCMASRTYQKAKLESLEKEKMPSKIFELKKQYILAKACICHDLAGAATETLGIDKRALTALTPGPNIINFSKISTLKEMVDHIYGRINLITSEKREHMFLKELELYVEQFKTKFETITLETVMTDGKKQLVEFGVNLLEGISYYRELSEKFTKEKKENFTVTLEALKNEVLKINKKIEIL
ncbi:MAG: hypothetical protein PF693_10120 [Spirochaetia bacterium]|jgi:hypothetical protein|nr:hypothetical protein [Spirochaetia bacterium]